jgi:hypothetical protein
MNDAINLLVSDISSLGLELLLALGVVLAAGLSAWGVFEAFYAFSSKFRDIVDGRNDTHYDDHEWDNHPLNHHPDDHNEVL